MMTEREFSTAVKNMRNRTAKLEREGDNWTKSDRELLMRLFYMGVGITDMAIQLQRTEPAVIQQIEKMDLYKRKLNPRRRKLRKDAACLCERCEYYSTACPRCENCKERQEW